MDMNSTRFRLERVRALREQREAQAKQKLAGAIARESEAAALLRSTDINIDAALRARRRPTAFDGAELLGHQIYMERLERNRRQVTDELRRRADDTEQHRVTLRVASQDRQALERLKEKTIAAQRLKDDRLQQRLLDEIAGNRHHRRAA